MTIYLVREYGADGLAVAGRDDLVAAYHFVAAKCVGDAVDMLSRTGAVNLEAVDCEDIAGRTTPAILATWTPADGHHSRNLSTVELHAVQALRTRERVRASVVAV